jgi:amidophosphoribosyltransferase
VESCTFDKPEIQPAKPALHMSELIKHECGIALIRLKKPLQYFIDTYQNPSWAVHKLYLLMEKQHNRGQDGAGVANIKLDMDPGKPYIHRYRTIEPNPIGSFFPKSKRNFERPQKPTGPCT